MREPPASPRVARSVDDKQQSVSSLQASGSFWDLSYQRVSLQNPIKRCLNHTSGRECDICADVIGHDDRRRGAEKRGRMRVMKRRWRTGPGFRVSGFGFRVSVSSFGFGFQICDSGFSFGFLFRVSVPG